MEPTQQVIPSFMADDVPLVRPDLDPATLDVGTQVVVIDPGVSRGRRKAHTGTVTWQGRVWITVDNDDQSARPKSWKFRMDDQTDGTASNYATRFYTVDQHRFHEASCEADQYLSDLKIKLDFGCTFSRIELARLIWSARNPATSPAVPFTVHHLDGTSTTH